MNRRLCRHRRRQSHRQAQRHVHRHVRLNCASAYVQTRAWTGVQTSAATRACCSNTYGACRWRAPRTNVDLKVPKVAPHRDLSDAALRFDRALRVRRRHAPERVLLKIDLTAPQHVPNGLHARLRARLRHESTRTSMRTPVCRPQPTAALSQPTADRSTSATSTREGAAGRATGNGASGDRRPQHYHSRPRH